MTSHEPEPPKSAAPSDDASPVGVIAAGLIAAALLLPFLLWGNPYPARLFPYWALGGLSALALGAALFAWTDGVLTTLAARIRDTPPWAFMLAIGALTTLLSAFFAVYAFHRFASTSDEIAQFWHARILLAGRWSLPVDPNREFFSLDTVVDSGQWYSQFPIGGPLVLAVGVAAGVPWLVNPMLAGGSAIAVYRFVRRAYDDSSARWASVLFATAPMVLMMAGTWMNHVPVLFFTTVGLAALAAWDQAATRRAGLASASAIGFCVGAIATIRPLDAVIFASVVGVFQLLRVREQPTRFTELLVQTVAGLCWIGLLLFANSRTTGRPVRFGYEVSWGAAHRVGFHVDPYGQPHTVLRGLTYVLRYVSELNADLMLWPVPVLLVLLVALAINRRPSRWDRLLLAFIAAQTLAYGAYWYRGELLGPRFLYSITAAAIVLVSRTPAVLDRRFGPRACRAAVAGMVACTIVAWLAPASTVGVVGMASHTRTQRQSLRADIAGAVQDAGVHHALVFLREQFSQRLVRRLWGLGVARGAALGLVQTRDACVLLAAIERAEQDSAESPGARIRLVTSVPPVVNPEGSLPTDPAIHVASRASVTPACAAEIDGDAGNPPVPFGAGLVLEPIDAHGRVDGDVIYVADLGAHNEALRPRFGDRAWYRLRLVGDAGHPRPVLRPY